MAFSAPSLRLFYFNQRKNFGDALNVDFFEKFGIPLVFSKPKNCRMVSIGSLLDCFFTPKYKIFKILRGRLSAPVLVWGTGFIYQNDRNRALFRRLDVRAVRGYKTLERLKSYSGVRVAENAAVGDPGLLVSKIFDVGTVQKKYKLGVVPHYADKESPFLAGIKVSDSIVLDIEQPTEAFVRSLAECEVVISSSMHGLVAADSLGIPNIRMVLSDNLTGGDYKFEDYYSAFGLTNHKKVDLRTCEFTDADVDWLKQDYPITRQQVEIICQKLMDSFPFEEIKKVSL